MITISAVIITYNEEHNIGRCLESIVDIVDEIIVVDSFSTDKTVRICQTFEKVRLIQRTFSGYGDQKNYGNSLATSHYILSLDADEALSSKLQYAILQVKKQSSQQYIAYQCNRLTQLGKKWIRHGGWYPDRKNRLWQREMGTWNNDLVHEKVELPTNAKIGLLKGDLLHYSYPDIQSRVKQLNKFSSLAAEMLWKKGIKTNWFKIIAKPCIKFFTVWAVKMGWRDGFYGFVVAKTSAYYVFLREVKLYELCQKD